MCSSDLKSTRKVIRRLQPNLSYFTLQANRLLMADEVGLTIDFPKALSPAALYLESLAFVLYVFFSFLD